MPTSSEHRVDTDGQVSDSIIVITVMAQLHLMDVLPVWDSGGKIKFYGRKSNWLVSICKGRDKEGIGFETLNITHMLIRRSLFGVL